MSQETRPKARKASPRGLVPLKTRPILVSGRWGGSPKAAGGFLCWPAGGSWRLLESATSLMTGNRGSRGSNQPPCRSLTAPEVRRWLWASHSRKRHGPPLSGAALSRPGWMPSRKLQGPFPLGAKALRSDCFLSAAAAASTSVLSPGQVGSASPLALGSPSRSRGALRHRRVLSRGLRPGESGSWSVGTHSRASRAPRRPRIRGAGCEVRPFAGPAGRP